MKIKHQWFRPGRRIEQIGGFAKHPFFTRREPPAGPAQQPDATAAANATAQRRGVLPYLAENAGALFSLVVSVVLVTLTVALVVAFVREIRRDTLQIDGFAAPKDLVDRGYTSAVIAEQILDEIRKIQGSLVDVTAIRHLEAVSAMPDIQVEAGGLSMKSVVRYARGLFNLPDNRIGGELVRDGTSLRLMLRMHDNAKLHVEGLVREDGNVDLLLADAGQMVAKLSDPTLLAEYLYRKELASRRFDRTLATVDYILTHPPGGDDWRGYGLLGDVRATQGKSADALKAYERALTLRPDDLGIRGAMALALETAGKSDEAAAIIKEGLRQPSNNAQQLASFAVMMDYFNRYDEMLEVARRAVKADPNSATAFGSLAIALGRKHRPEESLRAYMKGRSLAHSFDFDGRWGGIETAALINLGRVDEAFRIADSRVIANPENPWHLYSRALAAAALGRHAEAISAYPQLLLEDIPAGQVSVSWADSLLALGDIDSANVHYEKSVRENPRGAGAYRGLARVRVAKRDYAGSLPAFAEAIRLDADNAQVRRERAAALQALGRANDAAADLAAATEIEARLARPLPLP